MEFCALADGPERYRSSGAVLKRLGYSRLGKPDKGVVMRYLERTTGYSRQQLTRLVGRAREGAPLAKRYRSPSHGFARKYTAADVALLAQTDARHSTLSGPATVHLLRRTYTVFGEQSYQRLAGLSVSHLYNLRNLPAYQARRGVWTKTHPMGYPSASDGPQPRTTAPGSFASTVSTRATTTGSRAPTTSTRSTA